MENGVGGVARRAAGCLGFLLAFSVVTGSAQSSPRKEVTFNKDVLPILQRNCQACHRPGEIGPMSLLTFDATRPWAKSIREAVLTRKMPPWFADPQIGHFANERKLSDAEIETLVTWVDGGAPEGDPADKPAPILWADGWNIKPDVIYEMPKPYAVPGKGVVDYVYFALPLKFTEDIWVLDGEIRPGNRSVVHHATVYLRPPGSTWLREAKAGVPYISGKSDEPVPMESVSTLFAYVPGSSPQRYFPQQDDAGRLIPAGSDIVLQIHYTANGMETEDQTKIGLVVSKKRPPKQLLNLIIQDQKFEIPPNAPNYPHSAGVVLNEPVTLVYAQPHMHMRGTDMKIEVTYPDGRSEMVLSVPRYNYMWQVIYVLAKPLLLPKGTRIMVSGHWDNSANNKFNPDPSRTVRWGAQSWDEMFTAVIGAVVDAENDRYRGSMPTK